MLLLLRDCEGCGLARSTTVTKQRKAPGKRLRQATDEPETVAEAASVLPPGDASADADASFSQCDQHAAEMECEPPNVILELQRKIALLATRLANCQEKLSEAEKENTALLRCQFSLDKIKDDNAAVLFYTGFPSYEALISFYKYIEPKLSKMQYWKGENLVKESQPYQDDENKRKPGPSRKLTYLDEFLLGADETEGWSLCPRPCRQIWDQYQPGIQDMYHLDKFVVL